MRLRPWVAVWVGVTVLAACAQEHGPLEEESGDLDARIERTAQVAAQLEQAAENGAVATVAGGQ